MTLSLPPEILAQAQAVHEANMPDRCDIHRSTGTTWDEDAQATVETWEPVHTGLPCRLPTPTATGPVLVTGESVTLVSVPVRVPLAAHDVRGDDRVTITASPQDPDLVGTVVWVSHNRLRSLNTARLLECREVR